MTTYKYIAGKHGSTCYYIGEEHGNISKPVYFHTKKQCLNYIND